jgi:uncharacterized protein YbjQ (UPF0145 family)
MGFFDKPDDGGSGADRESLKRIEAGGIPADAERRLRELAGGGLFTSTLGVAEFALLSSLGPAPLAQVMGASVHQVGSQYLPSDAQWGGEVFCSLDRVEHAWDQARRRAFDRLTEEATLVDADAVVGVNLRRGEHDWARGTVDYVVSGTGIRIGPPERAKRWPVLSDLSVQDYWKLHQAGWAPAGLVAATAVMFVSQSSGRRWQRRMTATRNQELTEFTRGFTAARHTAVRYLRSQASAVGANGIVGVRFDHRVSREEFMVAIYAQRSRYSPGSAQFGGQQVTGNDSRRGIVVTIHAVGTAIRCTSAVAVPAPLAVLRVGESAVGGSAVGASAVGASG